MSGGPDRPPRPAPAPDDPQRDDPRTSGRRDPRYALRPGQQPQQPPRMPSQQAAPQSSPHAAPDAQAQWHDPHAGTQHPAYEPAYSALDQAVDVPHRPGPGPDYVPVDPVARGYQDPRGPQPAHGWVQPGPLTAPEYTAPQVHPQHPPQYGQSPQYAGAPVAGHYVPTPEAPPRMPRNPDLQAGPGYPQGEFDDGSRIPPWLRQAGQSIASGARASAASLTTGIAALRARRSEKAAFAARERARQEAARAADALDADAGSDPAGMRAPGRRVPAQKLTAKEKRWQRRRRRHVVEEIIGWILVPIILVALYFALVGGLALFGLGMSDLMDGLRMVREQFS